MKYLRPVQKVLYIFVLKVTYSLFENYKLFPNKKGRLKRQPFYFIKNMFIVYRSITENPEIFMVAELSTYGITKPI